MNSFWLNMLKYAISNKMVKKQIDQNKIYYWYCNNLPILKAKVL